MNRSTEHAITHTARPPLVGICGAKGAGKDTIADHMTEVFGYQRFSFADPIKIALASIFNVPVSMFHDPALKEKFSKELMGRSPRYLMQTLGTEWGRDKVSPSLWIDLTIKRIEAARLSGAFYIVVPDVRLDDEAQAIKDAGGVIWHVTRGSTPRFSDMHRSEWGIDKSLVDATILNNADTRMLFTQVGIAIRNAVTQLRSNHGQAL